MPQGFVGVFSMVQVSASEPRHFFFDCLTLYSYKAIILIHAKGGRRKDIYIVCIRIVYTHMAILLDGNSS